MELLILILLLVLLPVLVVWDRRSIEKRAAAAKDRVTTRDRGAAVGLVALTLFPFWEAWIVYDQGTLAAVSCDGLFSGSACTSGTVIGKLLFAPENQHLGYVLLLLSLNTLVLYGAYKVFRGRGDRRPSEA
jgi:hypothetical protein